MLNVLRRKPTWYATLGLCLTLGISLPAHADDLDILGQFISEQNLVTPEATPQAQFRELSFEAQQLGPVLTSQSALILDANTGRPLYQKSSNSVRPIASISKLMSAMVLLDAGLNPNERITITNDEIDRLKGTGSRLSIGTVLTREQLLHIGLMSSENRAIHALGRTYPGGMPAFVNAMNQKAQQLGMTNSRFVEPTGLSPQNVSTANDLAKMVLAASQYQAIRYYSTHNEAFIPTSAGKTQKYSNSNALVREGTWNVVVQKTGYIREAGRSMVVETQIQGRPIVMVLLNSPTSATRVNDARSIGNWVQYQGPV
ncbi:MULTISPECIES: D-alanyl-D-alanine carboxypeptidase family protein [Vitreoscilla]|uniref:D-alanyl-D-alanine endopeptidase n=1 Tax=Vitreoscilla stercoraria TaxID=61 RepID=A0ABY4EBW1_VITST|nr:MULTISPECIES: serine hydrolase [Vitreoscilla]AUZ05793.1 D-alanyl-D-alanine endopeptidase precursor [Vitreoscilla sp. C1]UOO92833.1 D-alanyl-D-alanine endopeptidase [Vitreoscilla stercoraria]